MTTPSSPPQIPQPPQEKVKDPMKQTTSNFQLQTKIRLIIQQVLSATVRKLSHFGQKMDRFQEYFITFKQRFETVQRQRIKQQQQMKKIEQIQLIIRRDLNMNEIKSNEDRQRSLMSFKQQKDDYVDMEKIVKTLVRQNQNINLELGKTKNRFLEYSNMISTVKEEVSWKITKYLEQTSESHIEMKVQAETMKNQYFNISLLVQKQKQKYDQIIIKYEEDQNFKQEMTQRLTLFEQQVHKKKAQMQRLNTKIDDLQFAFISKIKTADVKFDAKMAQLQKNNSKMTNIFKRVQNFSSSLQNVRSEVEQQNQNLNKKISENIKKINETINDEVIKLNKQTLNLQKQFERKISAYDNKLQKSQDFVLQKLQFLKLQIETQMANKTTKLIEQKAKDNSNINSSTMDQINGKLHKIQIETNKSVNRIQNKLNESIGEIKKNIDKVQDQIEEKIEKYSAVAVTNTLKNTKRQPQRVEVANSSVSNQNIEEIYAEINAVKVEINAVKVEINAVKVEINAIKQNLEQNLRQGLRQLHEKDEKIQRDLNFLQKNAKQFNKKQEDNFMQIQQRISNKIQKVMFLVTKMRGDLIIRNEYTDKEIKELRKNSLDFRDNIQSLWKIVPGTSQCINLILSLIFDAEFQHSKIIQDNLPLLSKDAEKFTTLCQGVIYEYKEKKKPGNILYRHSELKKIDIVKATFFGFIQVWQDLFSGFLKNKQHLLPKGFYKRLVQKNLRAGGKHIPEKQPVNQVSSTQNIQSFQNIPNIQASMTSNQRTTSTADNLRMPSDSNETMTNSFHIRKPNKKRQSRNEKQLNQRSNNNEELIDIKE